MNIAYATPLYENIDNSIEKNIFNPVHLQHWFDSIKMWGSFRESPGNFSGP